MIEYGKVLSLQGKQATVLIKRNALCGDCGACQIGKEKMTIEAEAENLVHAKVGEDVCVEMEFINLMHAGLIGYGIPLIAMILGFFLGWVVAPLIHLDQILCSFFTGMAFVALAYWGIHLLDKRGAFQSKYKPVITEILPEGFESRLSTCQKKKEAL